MKIIHINTYDGNGGAGKACLRLVKALKGQGIEASVWVYHKFRDSSSVSSFSSGLFHRLYSLFTILAERFLPKFMVRGLKLPFSLQLFGRSIHKHPALRSADIIHIHWINHGFLTPGQIGKLNFLNKPVVWTFHDSNTFTGGCHVRFGCTHYESECGFCPLLKKPGANDYSHKLWLKKEKTYQKLNFTYIAPSQWMKESASRAKLLEGKNGVVIPNTLNTQLFKPAENKETIRSAFGILPDKFIMLSGFMPSRKDAHKGTDYLVRSLELLAEKLGDQVSTIELVIFGNRSDTHIPDLPFQIKLLGVLQDEKELASVYAMADVFLIPSLEDNLPYTVMESLSCGAPVVTFTTGGIPDMVQHMYNGYIAEYKSAEDFARGIEWVFQHPEKQQLTVNARNTVLERFSEKIVAQQHIDLYQELLDKKDSSSWEDKGGLPRLSVITIVYNNAKDIERTMLSVLHQTYPNIEYIIIDGQSTDDTVEIIKKYEHRLAKFISEPDRGIYDAMNKGLKMATGNYVLFMNSGDEIYAADTVEKVFATAPDADIYYGETEMFDEQWNSLGQRRHKAPKQFIWKSFQYGMNVSHQAIYVRRSLAEPYDLTYQLSADIDWIIQAAKKATKIVNTNRYVAKYLVGGMSKKKHRQSLKERFAIMVRHYGLVKTVLNHAIIASNLLAYYLRYGRTND